MGKDDFLRQLNRALRSLADEERERSLQYYREIIDDRMEDGLTEAEAVGELEPIAHISARILEDAQARGALRKRKKPSVKTGLIIIGSPLWAVLLLAAFIVVLALYVSAWAVIAGLFVASLALCICLPMGILALLLYWSTNLMSAVFALGVGCFAAALGIVLYFPLLALAKWLVKVGRDGARRFMARLRREKMETT